MCFEKQWKSRAQMKTLNQTLDVQKIFFSINSLLFLTLVFVDEQNQNKYTHTHTHTDTHTHPKTDIVSNMQPDLKQLT